MPHTKKAAAIHRPQAAKQHAFLLLPYNQRQKE
jgi:hypothetical protein